MKKYYIAMYKTKGEDSFIINKIVDGHEENMKRLANRRIVGLAYSSIHESEEDAETEISILRLDYLKQNNKLDMKKYKKEVESLLNWLRFYSKHRPHLFV